MPQGGKQLPQKRASGERQRRYERTHRRERPSALNITSIDSLTDAQRQALPPSIEAVELVFSA